MGKKYAAKKIKKVVKKVVNKATGKKKPKIKKKTSTEKKPAAKKEETRYTPPNAKGTKERVRPDTRKGRTVKVEAKKGTGTDIVPVNGKKLKQLNLNLKKLRWSTLAQELVQELVHLKVQEEKDVLQNPDIDNHGVPCCQSSSR